MKLLSTIASCLLVFTMNGQAKKPVLEIHTRPISDLQGIINAGLEIQTSENSSILFDGGAGTSAFDGSTLTTFLIGARLYFTPESSAIRRELLKKAPIQSLEGLYVTARHSYWFVDNSIEVANTNMMIGKKVMIDKLSIAGEIGAGIQTIDGLTWVMPTLAVTIGHRLTQK
mgnify:CR=1 FL=1